MSYSAMTMMKIHMQHMMASLPFIVVWFIESFPVNTGWDPSAAQSNDYDEDPDAAHDGKPSIYFDVVLLNHSQSIQDGILASTIHLMTTTTLQHGSIWNSLEMGLIRPIPHRLPRLAHGTITLTRERPYPGAKTIFSAWMMTSIHIFVIQKIPITHLPRRVSGSWPIGCRVGCSLRKRLISTCIHNM